MLHSAEYIWYKINYEKNQIFESTQKMMEPEPNPNIWQTWKNKQPRVAEILCQFISKTIFAENKVCFLLLSWFCLF